MGIAPYLAEAIIREHRFRPITGDVLLLGRQTMQFSPEDAAAMIRAEGLVPAPLAPDDDLLERRTVAAHGKRYIRDDAFFRLLGVEARARAGPPVTGRGTDHDLNGYPSNLAEIAGFHARRLDAIICSLRRWGCRTTRLLRPGGGFCR
jgi:hypothetical protein